MVVLLYIDVAQYASQEKGHTSSRRALRASRRFFSLRRFHIHCPIFSDSTSPDLVRIFMWWETVGCESSTFASMSQAHIPTDLSMEQHPFSFSRERIRLRVGSAMAESTVLSSVLIDSHQCTLGIDGCQYKNSRIPPPSTVVRIGWIEGPTACSKATSASSASMR